MAAVVSVEIVRLGIGALHDNRPQNVIGEVIGPAVAFAGLTTAQTTGAVVGIVGCCWRVTVISGKIRVHPAAAAGAASGVLMRDASGPECLACVPGQPLSLIEVT